jgi:hypothetical protein
LLALDPNGAYEVIKNIQDSVSTKSADSILSFLSDPKYPENVGEEEQRRLLSTAQTAKAAVDSYLSATAPPAVTTPRSGTSGNRSTLIQVCNDVCIYVLLLLLLQS